MMKESAFQAKLIRRLKQHFPDSVVLKNDANYRQGIPDLIILNGDRWAALEVKAHVNAPIQPNQRHYIERMGAMGFAAFVYPEVLENVIDDLIGWFR